MLSEVTHYFLRVCIVTGVTQFYQYNVPVCLTQFYLCLTSFTCVFDHVSLEVTLVVELLVTVLTLELLQLVPLWGVAELDVFPQSVLTIKFHATVNKDMLI